ncbi:MAG TPA: glycosyltransferase family 2 protein [Myxococcota bacterium]|nr:glycosyltransferase family 2 protein [Myxococcota bacterium]
MISAIVVTHVGGDRLRRCVDSLEGVDELLVVVSAEAGTCDIEGVEGVVDLGENVRFAKASNAGFKQASGDWLLLLNDDTCAREGFADALRCAVEPGIYQPRILLADGSGRLDNVGHGLFPDGFNWAHGREDDDGPEYAMAGEVGACSGAAMLIHRRVLETVGDFDEDLEAFGEDVDLSLRAWRAGFPLRRLPEAVIEHELGGSYGRYGADKVFLVERNRVLLALRNLPIGALLTMPLWTTLRLAGLSAAALAGRGWSAKVPPGTRRAALRGMTAGLAAAGPALEKRRADTWVRSDRETWAHLWRNRVRVRDVVR